MPPSHEDVAEGFRRNPSAFTQVATHILEREKANTRTYHIPCELPKDLVGYGVNSVTTKGPCVFFEAVGIPIFSKGIVYCPRDDAVEQIRKAGPPYEEGFVELREIAPSWYQYVTN